MHQDKITLDLFAAYYDARRNKRNTVNALLFEQNMENHLFELVDEIIERRYVPRPSTCFIVEKPIKREIFAADFRDRIVHHFIFNYISPIFEKRFLHDCYSCRKGKGTHFGIQRVAKFMRSASLNYTAPCYVLKLDIKGYFMGMSKTVLLSKIETELSKWEGRVDFDMALIRYLIRQTIENDPTIDCLIRGQASDWNGLQPTKSLFKAQPNCGLPIGNLTSQLFGNIYLNDFDHWIKQELNIRYYGRYVDDFVLIHPDKAYLMDCIEQIRAYLLRECQLTLHPLKVYSQEVSKGVKFLGSVIKPHRIYIAARTKGNFYARVQQYNQLLSRPVELLQQSEVTEFVTSMNAYLGILKHYQTYNIRKKILFQALNNGWLKVTYIAGRLLKFVKKKNVFSSHKK